MISVSTAFGVTFVLAFIINYLYSFYSNAKRYPPGPLPLPVLGNFLKVVWKQTEHPMLAIHKLCLTYGKVATVWFGSKPIIFINDLEVAKLAFNQINCNGRSSSPIDLILSGKTFISYALQDWSILVKLHRKVSIESIRELLTLQNHIPLVKEVVNDTVNTIKSREQSKPFSPDLNLIQIPLRILAELIFGERFDEKQIASIEHSNDVFNFESAKMYLIQYLPIAKYLLASDEKSRQEIRKIPELWETSFKKCKESYKTGSCDNFVSILLTARNKMSEEKSADLNLFTDNDLIGILGTLFIGGIHSSGQAMNWLILLISYYPEMQHKLRREIADKIGNDIDPKFEDRKNCHYVMAFIHEVLRIRPVIPFGSPHTAMSDIVIDKYSIPKRTDVIVNQYAILRDPLYWKHPQEFDPERFLDSSGLFISSRYPAFIPFHVGKRLCPGERMAMEMLFLEVVFLMQATNGYQFELANAPQNGDLLEWSSPTLIPQPKPYKLILKPIVV